MEPAILNGYGHQTAACSMKIYPFSSVPFQLAVIACEDYVIQKRRLLQLAASPAKSTEHGIKPGASGYY